MKILFIGDVVGRPGREAILHLVPKIIVKENVEFVIANGENIAGGSGLTSATVDDLLNAGVDVITSGDHIWQNKDIYHRLEKDKNVLRPLNYPDKVLGRGFAVYDIKDSFKIAVVNLQGRVFMRELDSPFYAISQILKKLTQETKTIIVDIHAEATSEKLAIGYYLDGKVSAVLGTHTHIQTADERILPKGTAYITDAGMTGPYDSILGRKKEKVLERFLTNMPVRFPVAKKDIRLQGVILDISIENGLAIDIKRINLKLNDGTFS